VAALRRRVLVESGVVAARGAGENGLMNASDDARPVEISDDVIRLGQFLKLAGLAESGAEARELVTEGEVRVNGEVDTRRGRQLHRGDVVTVDRPQGGESATVA